MTEPLVTRDSDEMLHPDEGPAPLQFDELVLGGSPLPPRDFPTVGAPPFINRRLSVAEWESYVAGYDFGSLAPSRVVLHHTLVPTEDGWAGLATMRGMQRFYAGKGWTSAPHIFTAPDGIWLATPMSRVGIHAGTGNGSVRQGWYSIGLEMVGDYDDARPAGAVWAHSLAVLAGLSRRLGIAPRQLISFHRDYTDQKSCPGRAVTKDWVWSQAEAYLAATVPPPPRAGGLAAGARPYTADSPILAQPPVTLARLADAMFAHCHAQGSPYTREAADPIRRVIVPETLRRCQAAGVDVYVALAQLGVESGWLTSALSQRTDKDGANLRNGYGIGVWEAKARATPHPRPGTVFDADVGGYRPAVGFARWEDSVLAQVGRLLAYATRPGARSPIQQGLVTAALQFRPLDRHVHGSARTLRQLSTAHNPLGREGAGWAADPQYGDTLASAAQALWAASR